MKLKKLTALTLAAFTAGGVSVYADDLRVMYNSTVIEFQYAQPTIVSGRTLVPLRGVFDTMGYEISYDSATKTATIFNDETVIKASSQEMSVTQNGSTTVLNADVKPQLINDYFMVPLRAVASATGAEVDWDSNSRTVFIIDAATPEVENEVIEGTMKVEEKEYLFKVQETTGKIREFTLKNDDTLLKNAFGVANFESAGASEDYSVVLQSLNELKLLEAPDGMLEVQMLVEEYVDELISLIDASKTLSGEELTAMSFETSRNLSITSQNFGDKLWKYFIAHDVNFEKVYGETILDALKW